MMKFLLYIVLSLLCLQSIYAQTVEEKDIEALKSERQVKAKESDSLSTQIKTMTNKLNKLNHEILLLDDQITPWPRWSQRFLGSFGLNFVTADNWLLKEQPNTSAAGINLGANGYVLLDHLKYFWRSDYQLNLGWVKFDNRDIDDDTDSFQTANDIFNLKSNFGWKITNDLFFSLGADYRTSLLNGKFNNPGYLDLGGMGITWKPVPDFILNLYSANYNWVLADEGNNFTSSLGAKLDVTYTRPISKNLIWKTNLAAFASYKDLKELSNWIWFNSLTTNVKGFGAIFDIGLRGNRQEAMAFGVDENTLQVWWMLGLSYGISSPKKGGAAKPIK